MIRVGVGGWTYEPWRGTFYPSKLPHAKEIEHATRALTAIEINGTYYRRQNPKTFESWRKAAPDGFMYTVKASRFCTNRKNLADNEEGMRNFFDQGLVELGDKLGPILWQLMGPKQFDPDEIRAFFAMLPKDWGGVKLRHAFEPRHESFRNAEFFALARETGVAIVYAEADDYPNFADQTGPFTYARYQQCREDVEAGYGPGELDRIADQTRGWAEGGRDVFAFFIAGAKVRAPAAAMALIGRVGRH
ncbi:DUF72 domain-containing protein [Sphingomonas sp.]|jgi:uncharacterized protein YecE (DUF72 family)|uniref:DUF72 domain-containing protein n=1 Tax=Sphingomonas sp. TaxID=28214 RepID=UPI002DF517E7|nr:DUF72 domain-containing protein [Sphingomonas sp.]